MLKYKITNGLSYLDDIYQLSMDAGWNQTIDDLNLLCNLNPDGCFCAISENESAKVFGSTASFNAREKIAWISMVLIHPQFRRLGIATKLLYHTINFVRQHQNKMIVGLDATDLGQGLYKKAGFQTVFQIHRCFIQIQSSQLKEKLTFLELNEISVIEDFLINIGLSYYVFSLKTLLNLPNVFASIILENGEIKGVAISRRGRKSPFIGPVIAINQDSANRIICHHLLFWKKKNHLGLLIDIPDFHFSPDNEKKNLWLSPITVTWRRQFSRMYQLIASSDQLNPANRELSNLSVSESYHESIRFIEQELAGLKYLYASGGPEIG